MTFGSSEQIQLVVEVSDYHLIFDLNGVLVAIGEGQIRSHLIVLKHGLKEFLSTCKKKFTMYIWSSVMKRNFSTHLDIIVKKISVLLPSSKILDQTLCFINDHFLLEAHNKHVFHKNLKDFFHLFPNFPFENTLLVDNTFHKNMLNPPCSAIFFKTFYRFHINNNYLFHTVFPYLESLHSFGMSVYKFVALNPFGNSIDMPFSDPHYENLNVYCFAKCD
jgi:hypothetical protein